MENCLNPTTKGSQKRELVTRLLDDKYIASYCSDYFDNSTLFQNLVFRKTTADGLDDSINARVRIDTVNAGDAACIITDFVAGHSGNILDGKTEANSQIELSVLQGLNTMTVVSAMLVEHAHVDDVLDMPCHYYENTGKVSTTSCTSMKIMERS